ncbi:transposable element Tcb2 transposase [Trichonephila clavipes]|nr:transposable element Tcb2 transposase [Trichonephila clavipes]
MPLHCFRRQYEQLEKGRIIGMMEAGWSARRVARQLGRSDCVGTSGSERSSRRHRQTSHREDRHIIKNARVQPTASSAAIQAQIAPSLRAL